MEYRRKAKNQGDWRRKVESERDDEIIWIREEV